MRSFLAVLLVMGAGLLPAAAASTDCSTCAEWNKPQAPFKIYGNTYYVGVHGLSAILITSDKGDILIDGDLAESAPLIADHIRALGFDIHAVKRILNSHAHFDHAGGIAELQRLSGATVMASPWTAKVMRQGAVATDDPQFGAIRPIARVANVKTIANGGVVILGPLALTAHFTPGHTPGGTTWTWVSCEAGRCLNMVFADSLTAVSADTYNFSDHPDVVRSFGNSLAVVAALPCDILLTPHPEVSSLLEKAARGGESPNPFIAPDACRKFSDTAQAALAKRLAAEKAAK